MNTVTRPPAGVAGLDGLDGLDELPHADPNTARQRIVSSVKRMSAPPPRLGKSSASDVPALLFNADLEESGRPAAAESAAAIAGVVVRGEMQDVVAGLREFDGRRRLPAEGGGFVG